MTQKWPTVASPSVSILLNNTLMRTILLSFVMTWQNILAAKLRTFLTILGIIIGIASIIVVMSAGSSAQNLLLSQIRNIGSNLIAILPGASSDTDPPAMAFGIVSTTLTENDVVQLRNKTNFPHILDVSGYVSSKQTVRANGKKNTYEIQGVDPDMINIENATLASGRFISDDENARGARVAVLGADIATFFFSQENPLGKTLHIKGNNYRIIGTLKKRGKSFAGNFDETIYIPLTTAQNILMGINYLTFARLRVDDEDHIASTKDNIRRVLKSRHHIPPKEDPDFSVRDITSAIRILSNITNVMKYFLVTVAGIALLVGGIGVMNMMLITLNKRIREIGLRVALGARTIDIALQFLAESVLISLLGGVIGSIIGFGIINVIATIAHRFDLVDWIAVHNPVIYLIAFALAGTIGIIFGIYPALKATKISPMEALRYE